MEVLRGVELVGERVGGVDHPEGVALRDETLEGALEDVNVQIKGDYEGHPCDEGDAVKVISSEDRKDLARDEYIETLLPTVRLVSKAGALLKVLQQAEVVVGKASGSK